MNFSTRNLTWLVLSVTFLFVIDRLLRWYALYQLPVEGKFIISQRVGLLLSQNSGLVFGEIISQPGIVSILVMVIILLVGVMVYLVRRKHFGFLIPLGLLLVGTFSNFLDRIQHGYVVDMLTVTGQTIFNVADIMIVVGVVWIITGVLKNKIA